MNKPTATARARSLRRTQTNSEQLLWSVLRAQQLCGLKFRRQHPIASFITDFACPARRLVVEIDGEYHDAVVRSDVDRERCLRDQGWDVLRFTVEEVEQDVEVVARAIAEHLHLAYSFRRREGKGSGMRHMNAARGS